VDLSSLKVTAVRVGVAQAVVEVRVPVEPDVLDEGQAVLVAELQGPEADPPEQEDGSLACNHVSLVSSSRDQARLRTDEAPHEAGTTFARALYAVRNAAYDQVRSTAEAGLPFERRYCSARAPLAGVYFSCGVSATSLAIVIEQGLSDSIGHVAVGIRRHCIDD
jgi:hypothetical protein